MIQFLKTKLLKNYPLSRIVEFNFIDTQLSEKNKKDLESKIMKYKPPIKGLEINKELSQIESTSTISYINLTLRIPHYMSRSLDEITEEVKTNFIAYYNTIN